VLKFPTLIDIQEARERIASEIHETPIFTCQTLDQLTGYKILLKAENMQKTGSFKARGALNALLQLDSKQANKGVIAVSAGNHAGAVAWAAKQTNIKATVVMPVKASKNKIAATIEYGAEVILAGLSMVQAFIEMERLKKERHLKLIHPFDDPKIIAGAGTIALELFEQINDLDAVIIPVGGGGLISGMATAMKAIAPKIQIIGVEPEGADSMYESLSAGLPVCIPTINTVADGLALGQPGEITFPIVRDKVDQLIVVNDNEIKYATKFVIERCKLLVETAGAAALAALLFKKINFPPNAKIAVILSGGNVDLELLGHLSD
jgi:threonine dehydratase